MYKVSVLMSTYNGEKYLREQIESLLKQQNVELTILARDDGSTDSTCKILEEYKKKGILEWYTGENLRPAKSFMNLIDNAPKSDYYAFCDQDDVWNYNKLIIAISELKKIEEMGRPCLYCSNYQLVDAELNNLPDNNHVTTTSFASALVSSCCTGCTTVFNKALLDILRIGQPEIILMHDDWVHKVCLAVGGIVVYDNRKTLKYRQHGNNADGGVHGISDKIKQIYSRIKYKDCIRSKQIAELLCIYGSIIPFENHRLAELVANYRNKNIIYRFRLAYSKVITTSYPWLNKGFRLAIIFKYF